MGYQVIKGKGGWAKALSPEYKTREQAVKTKKRIGEGRIIKTKPVHKTGFWDTFK